MPGSHDLVARLEALLDGVPGKTLAERAGAISEAYRDNRSSRETISDARDAAVYALTRMPATAAAVAAVFDALDERAPDFVPATLLDAGAGPGTASLVATEIWPEAELTLCDSHKDFLDLAQSLMSGHTANAAARPRFVAADIARPGAPLPEADLVIASYALTELDDAAYEAAAARLWAATRGVLAVVEPGRPRDYHRLMGLRRRVIGEGGRMLAPCPHAGPCGLLCGGSNEDWCHFSVRLPRSRSHVRLKKGALGYEDEKFSYLVLARPEIATAPPCPRVLAIPEVAKHEIRLKLCETDGSVGVRGFARRHPEFGRIRRARWGKCVDEGDVKGHQ